MAPSFRRVLLVAFLLTLGFAGRSAGQDSAKVPSAQQIEEMLQEDPGDPFLWYGLAMEQLAAGEHQTALGTFDELRRRCPDYVPAYVQAGQLLVRLDREEEDVGRRLFATP